MVEFRNSDFVLAVADDSPEVSGIVNKYETFLGAHCAGDYGFQRGAVRAALRFLLSREYRNLGELAAANYQQSSKLQQKYSRQGDYLAKFPLKEKKACSLDLATGTGKSYVIYALAQIALAEGVVDKVLVLCPSLTIEEGLTEKFEHFAGDMELKQIIREVGALYGNPGIKNANEPILAGDICVENIHAVYDRTGSSIEDSFKGKGARVLVINDEAHHIFSDFDIATKKWLSFLQNEEYGFQYIVNLSGTPYIGDEYFHDIIYRFSIKDAIDKGVVKRVDYKLKQGEVERGFQDSYALHQKNRQEYGDYLKPVSIVVTEKIASCIKAWKELVEFIAGQEGIPEEAAKRRVIWVTSSVPGEKTAEGKAVRDILGSESAEKQRKANLLLLKNVDDSTNPVEWIVSVSMLTEGWDVKNVFQVVPHENRAFNSKLLISQVLGRGLRIPASLKKSGKTPLLTVNNHERWTSQIENLYRDVLEVENRLSWGYDPRRSRYDFTLHNLLYESKLITEEKKNKPASDPKTFGLQPQNRSVVTTDTFSETGEHKFTIMTTGNCELDAAATMLHGYLKMKDAAIGQRWPKSRIREAIEAELKGKGYDATFLSKENYERVQQAFGTLMRKTDETYPRFSLKSAEAQEKRLSDLPRSTFHEGALKNEGLLYYDSESAAWFVGEQRALFDDLTEKSANFSGVAEELQRYGVKLEDIIYLKDNIKKVEPAPFKSPLSMLYVSYKPEREFSRLLFAHSDLYDSFIKNPDKGFYSFPYSYKPETKARTHVKQENFNPDFFLKKGSDVIVVEIKKDGDDNNRNRAKLRDGSRHFSELNDALEKQGKAERYAFKFLSPPDYELFFQALRDGGYQGWQSGLMNELRS